MVSRPFTDFFADNCIQEYVKSLFKVFKATVKPAAFFYIKKNSDLNIKENSGLNIKENSGLNDFFKAGCFLYLNTDFYICPSIFISRVCFMGCNLCLAVFFFIWSRAKYYMKLRKGGKLAKEVFIKSGA